MLPIAAFPLHDPDGSALARLRCMEPDLQRISARVVISPTHLTRERQAEALALLARNPLYHLVDNPADVGFGDQCLSAYRAAIELSAPEQTLHLCFEDRLSYALAGEHRVTFLADWAAACAEGQPILYQRSERAWNTHPRTYWAIEAMATAAGELLFGRRLDFAWCHLALRAGVLAEALPALHGGPDLTILAELVLALRERIITRDVDWLAWEDPFVLGVDAAALQAERELDTRDHEKRLGYVVPIVRAILKATPPRP